MIFIITLLYQKKRTEVDIYYYKDDIYNSYIVLLVNNQVEL